MGVIAKSTNELISKNTLKLGHLDHYLSHIESSLTLSTITSKINLNREKPRDQNLDHQNMAVLCK